MSSAPDERAPWAWQWKDWQAAPWGRLRYSAARLNIARHLNGSPLRVPDIGGGNGVDSIYCAQHGHSAALLDAGPAMIAEATRMAEALKAVGAKEYFHLRVNPMTARFSAEEFIALVRPNGCALVGHCGMAGLCRYLPNERKSDPRYFADLERLEHRLTDTYPYYLPARFFQISCAKGVTSPRSRGEYITASGE